MRVALALPLALAALGILAGPAVAQYPTIVGSWYEPAHGQGDCTSPFGLHIRPMSLLMAESVCTFDTVARDGWEVTWTGQCRFPDGTSEPNMTVRALETEGVLSFRFNDGQRFGDYRRCPAGLAFGN